MSDFHHTHEIVHATGTDDAVTVEIDDAASTEVMVSMTIDDEHAGAVYLHPADAEGFAAALIEAAKVARGDRS